MDAKAFLPTRIIRDSECKQITGLSRVSRWRMEKEGRFPQRIRLGENSIGWRLDEVMDWLESRPRGSSPTEAEGALEK